MLKMNIEITGGRIYENVTLGNATIFEILKVEAAGFTADIWQAGYLKLDDIVTRDVEAQKSGTPLPEGSMTAEDLSIDGDYIRSCAISVWIARLRAGETLTFDESTKDWAWADFKPSIEGLSEFAAKEDDVADPTQPELTPQGSAPVNENLETEAPTDLGQTPSSSTSEII